MVYLLCYLVIGFSVALLMAHLQKRRSPEYAHFSYKMMLGAYIFIALAWPISLGAFLYGALSTLLVHAEESE